MKDVNGTPTDLATQDQLEDYRRLVELQGQIVELARTNSETEKHCHALRRKFERDNFNPARSNTAASVSGSLRAVFLQKLVAPAMAVYQRLTDTRPPTPQP